MLVLSRKKNESLDLTPSSGEAIAITVVEVRGDKVRLGIAAPASVTIHRREVSEAIARGETPSRQPADDFAAIDGSRPSAVALAAQAECDQVNAELRDWFRSESHDTGRIISQIMIAAFNADSRLSREAARFAVRLALVKLQELALEELAEGSAETTEGGEA